MQNDNVYHEPTKTHRINEVWTKLHRSIPATIGLYGTLILIIFCFIDEWITPYTLHETTQRMLPPAWSRHGDIAYFLGTNQHGEDILSKLIYGIAPTFGAAIIISLCVCTIGLMIGIIAAFKHKASGNKTFYTFSAIPVLPSILIAVIIVAIFGTKLSHSMIAIFFALLPRFILTVYQLTTREKNKDYVMAARLDGANTRYIIWHTLLPNIIPHLINEIYRIFSLAIIELSFLAFLGLSQSTHNEWGTMIREGSQIMDFTLLPLFYPGIAILISTIFIYLLSHGIKKALYLENN